MSGRDRSAFPLVLRPDPWGWKVFAAVFLTHVCSFQVPSPMSMFACAPSMYKYLGKRPTRGTVCKYMVVPWQTLQDRGADGGGGGLITKMAHGFSFVERGYTHECLCTCGLMDLCTCVSLREWREGNGHEAGDDTYLAFPCLGIKVY